MAVLLTHADSPTFAAHAYIVESSPAIEDASKKKGPRANLGENPFARVAQQSEQIQFYGMYGMLQYLK